MKNKLDVILNVADKVTIKRKKDQLCLKLRKAGIPMAGRKPKPTAIKKLEGNPGKRKLNTKEPIPAKDWRR